MSELVDGVETLNDGLFVAASVQEGLLRDRVECAKTEPAVLEVDQRSGRCPCSETAPVIGQSQISDYVGIELVHGSIWKRT